MAFFTVYVLVISTHLPHGSVVVRLTQTRRRWPNQTTVSQTRPSFWEPLLPPSLLRSRPEEFQHRPRQAGIRQHDIHVWHFWVCTRLAGVDAVVVLRGVAAAMFGFVVESFLQVIHAPLTA